MTRGSLTKGKTAMSVPEVEEERFSFQGVNTEAAPLKIDDRELNFLYHISRTELKRIFVERVLCTETKQEETLFKSLFYIYEELNKWVKGVKTQGILNFDTTRDHHGTRLSHISDYEMSDCSSCNERNDVIQALSQRNHVLETRLAEQDSEVDRMRAQSHRHQLLLADCRKAYYKELIQLKEQLYKRSINTDKFEAREIEIFDPLNFMDDETRSIVRINLQTMSQKFEEEKQKLIMNIQDLQSKLTNETAKNEKHINRESYIAELEKMLEEAQLMAERGSRVHVNTVQEESGVSDEELRRRLAEVESQYERELEQVRQTSTQSLEDLKARAAREINLMKRDLDEKTEMYNEIKERLMIEVTQTELRITNELREEFQKERGRMRLDLEEMEQDLKTKQEECADLSAQRDKNLSQIQILKARLESILQTEADADEKLSQMEKDLREELLAEKHKWEGRFESEVKVVDDLRAKLTRASEENDELKNQLQDLHIRLTRTEEHNESLKRTIQKLEAEIEMLKQQLTDLRIDSEHLSTADSSLKDLVDSLQRSGEEKDGTIRSLRQELIDNMEELSQLKTDLQETVEELEREREDAAERIAELEAVSGKKSRPPSRPISEMGRSGSGRMTRTPSREELSSRIAQLKSELLTNVPTLAENQRRHSVTEARLSSRRASLLIQEEQWQSLKTVLKGDHYRSHRPASAYELRSGIRSFSTPASMYNSDDDDIDDNISEHSIMTRGSQSRTPPNELADGIHNNNLLSPDRGVGLSASRCSSRSALVDGIEQQTRSAGHSRRGSYAVPVPVQVFEKAVQTDPWVPALDMPTQADLQYLPKSRPGSAKPAVLFNPDESYNSYVGQQQTDDSTPRSTRVVQNATGGISVTLHLPQSNEASTVATDNSQAETPSFATANNTDFDSSTNQTPRNSHGQTQVIYSTENQNSNQQAATMTQDEWVLAYNRSQPLTVPVQPFESISTLDPRQEERRKEKEISQNKNVYDRLWQRYMGKTNRTSTKHAAVVDERKKQLERVLAAVHFLSAEGFEPLGTGNTQRDYIVPTTFTPNIVPRAADLNMSIVDMSRPMMVQDIINQSQRLHRPVPVISDSAQIAIPRALPRDIDGEMYRSTSPDQDIHIHTVPSSTQDFLNQQAGGAIDTTRSRSTSPTPVPLTHTAAAAAALSQQQQAFVKRVPIPPLSLRKVHFQNDDSRPYSAAGRYQQSSAGLNASLPFDVVTYSENAFGRPVSARDANDRQPRVPRLNLTQATTQQSSRTKVKEPIFMPSKRPVSARNATSPRITYMISHRKTNSDELTSARTDPGSHITTPRPSSRSSGRRTVPSGRVSESPTSPRIEMDDSNYTFKSWVGQAQRNAPVMVPEFMKRDAMSVPRPHSSLR